MSEHIVILYVGGVLVAADYSQLELRMIAHLANDSKLMTILNGGEDVFRSIAGQLNMAAAAGKTGQGCISLCPIGLKS